MSAQHMRIAEDASSVPDVVRDILFTMQKELDDSGQDSPGSHQSHPRRKGDGGGGAYADVMVSQTLRRAVQDMTALLPRGEQGSRGNHEHKLECEQLLALSDSTAVSQATCADSKSDMDTASRGLASRAATALHTILAIACTRVKTTPFQLVSAATLRAYTDASMLLGTLILLLCCRTGAGTNRAKPHGRDGRRKRRRVLAGIRRLDMAIIVAGAVGPGRLAFVHSLIGALQCELGAADEGTEDDMPQRKRSRFLSPSTEASQQAPPFTPLFAPFPIPTIIPPSIAAYPALSARPFVLRGYLLDGITHPPWPALERWRAARYLLQAVGRGRVVPVEVGGRYDEEGWGQRIVSFEEFLRAAGWDVAPEKDDGDEDYGGEREDAEGTDDNALIDSWKEIDVLEPQPQPEAELPVDDRPLYLGQHTLFTQFPALERDTALPDYVWADPPAPVDMPGYEAPEDVLVNVWIGPGGRRIVSPAHTDPYFNCYAQVLGSKRVWVAPPDCGPHMYAYGGGDTATESHSDGDGSETPRPSPTRQEEGEDTLAGEYMTNTSTVPIFRRDDRDDGDCGNRDRDFAALAQRFPRFVDHVFPRAMEAVLYPGDLLVLPPGWWHAMRGEGEGVCWSVSFWY